MNYKLLCNYLSYPSRLWPTWEHQLTCVAGTVKCIKYKPIYKISCYFFITRHVMLIISQNIAIDWHPYALLRISAGFFLKKNVNLILSVNPSVLSVAFCTGLICTASYIIASILMCLLTKVIQFYDTEGAWNVTYLSYK